MGALLHFGIVLAGLFALGGVAALLLIAVVGVLIVKTFGTGK